ncbi:RRM domain-containing protein [Cryptosporidium ubiquitum]|uniref:RRM domain-containing protein n=1 Tax=Cryptosporidium ubiquitum TaxID=857276 RepID=A0A1J4ML88_9CRYT|nr:RRM domain-containing protein [Cryptosporidium ubiquitum]OII75009.1 RRM domain-containing protein [Cryptosporidium ubiquitum]
MTNRLGIKKEERDIESEEMLNNCQQLPCSALEFLTGEYELEEEVIVEYRNVVSLLSKEQLVDILSKSAYLYNIIGNACKLIVERSPVSRRVMVRNISFQTSDKVFLNLFEKFGEIEDSTIIREKNGRSRGYGFVTYKSSDSIKKLFNENLILNGRQLLVKLAADPFSEFTCGPIDCTKQVMESNQRLTSTIFKKKLFIRNLSESTTNESLRQAFSEFEDIEECFVMRDHNTGKSRKYGFITFNNLGDMMKVLQHPERIVDGKVTFVSLAFKQKDTSNVNKKSETSAAEIPGSYPLSFPVQSGYFYDYYNALPHMQLDLQNKNLTSENVRSQHQMEVYPYVNQCYYTSNPCFTPYFIPYAPYGVYSNLYALHGNNEHNSKEEKDKK